MKVQKTFEFDDELRFGVAMEVAGELRLGTREECRTWLANHVAPPMTEVRSRVNGVKLQLQPATEDAVPEPQE